MRRSPQLRRLLGVASATLTVIHVGAVAVVLCAPQQWLTEDSHVTKLVEACQSLDMSCLVGSAVLVLVAMTAMLFTKSEPQRPAAVAWLAMSLLANFVLSCLMPAFGFA